MKHFIISSRKDRHWIPNQLWISRLMYLQIKQQEERLDGEKEKKRKDETTHTRNHKKESRHFYNNSTWQTISISGVRFHRIECSQPRNVKKCSMLYCRKEGAVGLSTCKLGSKHIIYYFEVYQQVLSFIFVSSEGRTERIRVEKWEKTHT